MVKKVEVDLNYIIRYLYKVHEDKIVVRKVLKAILPNIEFQTKK